MALTIADQQASYFERVVDVFYQQLGCSGSVSSFDLYRRAVATGVDDLGVPADSYSLIHADVTCALLGLQETREGAFEVLPQGAVQYPLREVITALLDIRAGDSLILAQDGKGYGIERAERFGPLLVVVLNRASAQVG